MIIAVDFDGIIVQHRYPAIGKPVPYALECLRLLQTKGHKLILYTMRDGLELDEAVKYCKKEGIEFWGINKNPEQKQWTSSPKIYAHVYIDDAGYGVPIIYDEYKNYVDWKQLYESLSKDSRLSMDIKGEIHES